MGKTILEIKDLFKEFDDDAGKNVILRDVNLTVDEKEFLCILGPSGCGKTTLLRCIAGFESFKGELRVDGTFKNEPGPDRIMVFQDFNQLFPWLTVEKNIQYALKVQGVKDKKELSERTSKALNQVRLGGYEKYYPHQLSGGMKQRVAIAKAMALKPKIILMDEPFAALDAMTRRDLQNEMIEISAKEDCTIVFITHNIQEALILGTRIMVLTKEGKIVYDEKNELEKPITPASKEYGKVWEKLHSALYYDSNTPVDKSFDKNN